MFIRRLFATKIGYTNNKSPFIYIRPFDVNREGKYDMVELDSNDKNKIISKSSLIKTTKIGEVDISISDKLDSVVVSGNKNNTEYEIMQMLPIYNNDGLNAKVNEYNNIKADFTLLMLV